MNKGMHRSATAVSVALVLLAGIAGGCARRQVPVATRPTPSLAPPPAATAPAPPAPSSRVEEAQPAPPEGIPEDSIANRPLDELNRDSPLKPVFFPLDGADLDAEGRAAVAANAAVLKRYPTWVATIEGHCDERGTSEYNLALGERRAVVARTYLVSLGIGPDRVRTVSYGKEFPFDPGHDDKAWTSNRRAHFVIASK